MMEVPGLKIAGPLGRGGTALVARAYSDDHKKDVAVKYPLSDNSESSAQFLTLAKREYELIGNLKFPGIVNLLKFSQNPVYLLLELCTGQSLDKLGKVEDKEMLQVIISATVASMELIKLRGIIHCDLKPQNIFLPEDFATRDSDDLFFAKISDFSLGRFSGEPETARAGHGTVGYAAPETLALGKSSHRSDLFSLGVIAYQLATGIHPFIINETDPVKIEGHIQEDEPVPIFQLRNDLSKEFIDLVSSLLAKVDTDRPESAWQICQKLKKCGCLYPFEKVVNPSFLMRSGTTYQETLDCCLELNDSQKNRLMDITSGKEDYLRLVLYSNFIRGNLNYNGNKFEFNSNLYWPSKLRRKALGQFFGLGFAKQKNLIELSIAGSISFQVNSIPGLKLLVPNLLSTSTVKAVSKKSAPQTEKSKEWPTAAKLYLQAGMLEDAVRCTEKSAQNLKDADSRTKAIHLINRVFEFAQLLGKEFEVRQLLMSKGDIERANGSIDSALATYNRLVGLYQGNPPDKLLAETYRDLGDLYKTRQKVKDGIEVLTKALDIYRVLKDDLEMSRALNNIGELYRIGSDLDNSLKYMRQALSIQKKCQDTAAVANSLNNIAIIYGTRGQLNRTIKILEISLEIKRRLNDQGEIARALNNLGYAYQLSGDFEKAQSYLEESLAINRKIGSKREIYSNLWNLAETLTKCGLLNEAVTFIKEGYEISVTLNLKPHQAHMLKSLGSIYLRMSRFADAQKCLAKSSEMVKEIDDKVLNVRLNLTQSELRYELGDSKAAVQLAENALTESVALKSGLEELQALILLVRVLGKLEYLGRARNMVEELKLKREKLVLEFAYLDFLLGIDAKADLKRLFAPLESQFAKVKDDIEYPKLLNTAAEVLITCGERTKAAELLKSSLQIAMSKNLATEEITAHILDGRISFDEGRYEQAFVSYKKALQSCKQAVQTIPNDNDKQGFMKKPKMVFLANQIRQLSEKLGTKQKAGV